MGGTPDGGCAVVPHTRKMIIPKHGTHRIKPTLSDHQKQIRFFTGLAMFISFLFVGAFVWLMNQTSYISR